MVKEVEQQLLKEAQGRHRTLVSQGKGQVQLAEGGEEAEMEEESRGSPSEGEGEGEEWGEGGVQQQ